MKRKGALYVMAHTYVICNNKGGVHKTTDTIQIGYLLAQRGYRVLIVSMDAQCNVDYTLTGTIEDDEDVDLSTFLAEFEQFEQEYDWSEVPDFQLLDEAEEEGPETFPGEGVPTLYDVIIGINGDERHKRPIQEVIIQIPQEPNLFLAKGSVALSDMDIRLASSHGREKILKKALDAIQHEYDFILIDTPPTLGLAPVNAFVAAGMRNDRTNGIILATSAQNYSVLGVRTFLGAIYLLRQSLDIPLPIFGVICGGITRTRNVRKRLAQLRGFFGKAVFKTTVPRSEKVEEAADLQIPLLRHAPKNPAALAYDALTIEILQRAGLPLMKEEEEVLVPQQQEEEQRYA